MPAAPPKPDLAWVRLDEALSDGLEDLLALHYEEVDPHAAVIPMEIDWGRYRALERAGEYRALVMRRGRKLMGYNGFFVQPMLHSKRFLWALNDALYLAPVYRQGPAAIAMLVEAERRLGELGVREIVYGANLPNLDLSRMFSQCGYGHIENRHSKVLA